MNIEFIIKKYSKLIYKICFNILNNQLDAQDITQEVYIAIYKNIDSYINLSENEIKNIVCKIALNKCKDFLKSKINKLQFNDIEDNKLEEIKNDLNLEEELFKKEQKLNIHKMINELSNPYNIILYEYYINELTLDNISLKLNIPKATLKVQIYRAKKLLKKRLEKDGDIYE